MPGAAKELLRTHKGWSSPLCQELRLTEQLLPQEYGSCAVFLRQELLSKYSVCNPCVSYRKAMENSQSLAEFGFNLYKMQTGANVFFSPISIVLALSMVYLGSVGDTKTEISKVIFGGADQCSAKLSMSQLLASVEPLESQYGNMIFHVANRMYVSQAAKILESYKRAVRKHLEADAKPIDVSDSEAAAKKVNKFISKETNGKITKAIDSLDKFTTLLLVNTIYFKAEWETEFSKEQTTEGLFYRNSTHPLKMPMMRARSTDFLYYENEKYQVLGMPYKISIYSMFVILPKSRSGLAETTKSLSGKELLNIFENATPQDVTVTFPKFAFENSISLEKSLKELGLGNLFTPGKANLSAIDPEQPLRLSKVLHNTFLKVDEEGTEAAAVTVVDIVADSAIIRKHNYSFNADHPFIFAIVDMSKQYLLFLGRFSGYEN
uniref:SERPIN domain-containing protein n=1 Tax=Trichuris muris TaxID=70415 RepID=A0A5S6QPT9_TRIMR